MNPETFIAQCAAHGLVLNDQQIAQFERYYHSWLSGMRR